jgi:hypothetical protein
MIRELGPDDRAAIEALLTARIDQAMFPLTSLRTYGLTRGDFASPHDHAVRIWLTKDSLIALTRAGMILPLLADAPDLTGLPQVLAGHTVAGAVGPAASVRPILAALGLDRHPTTTNRDEPGFALDLTHLTLPDLPDTSLRPITPDDLPLLTRWRETYIGEVLGQTGPKARRRAEAELASYLAKASHRLLLHRGRLQRHPAGNRPDRRRLHPRRPARQRLRPACRRPASGRGARRRCGPRRPLRRE